SAGVPCRRMVVISKTVDQAALRMPFQYSFDVNDIEVRDFQRRNDFITRKKTLDLRGKLRLTNANKDILPPLPPSPSFRTRFSGLADAGRIAKEDFQMSAILPPFFLFDLFEKALRVRPEFQIHSLLQ